MERTLSCKSTCDPQNPARIVFSYLAEGGANVVFSFIKPSFNDVFPWFCFVDSTDGNDTLWDEKSNPVVLKGVVGYPDIMGKVLRVSKGVDKTLRCDEIVSGFCNDIQPLFVRGSIRTIVSDSTNGLSETALTLPDVDLRNHLMEHERVMLSDETVQDLMAKCDRICEKNLDGSLSRDPRWGILLPDLTPEPDMAILIELKPKWLSQSPSSPPNAVRCRTCAMQVAKPKDAAKYLCPLRLVSGEGDDIYPWILDRVNEKLAKGLSRARTRAPKYASLIVEYLTQGDGKALLQHLEFLQTHLDPQGITRRPKENPNATFDRNLRLAMTLRDCSLFLTVTYNGGLEDFGPVTVTSVLGDLDFKSADKIDDWLSKEKELESINAYTKKVEGNLGCVLNKTKG